MTADVYKKQVALGFMSRDPLNEFNHALDLMWDFNWKTRGFKGYPMILRWAT